MEGSTEARCKQAVPWHRSGRKGISRWQSEGPAAERRRKQPSMWRIPPGPSWTASAAAARQDRGRWLPPREPAPMQDASLALQAAGFARFSPRMRSPRVRALSRLMLASPLLLPYDTKVPKSDSQLPGPVTWVALVTPPRRTGITWRWFYLHGNVTYEPTGRWCQYRFVKYFLD